MTSQQRDFNLHFKTGPASAAITSVYLVGQRWRLPTRRQPGDRWAAHASVFILPEQTPKPQTAFAPLLRQHPPPPFACAELQEPNSTTTSLANRHFRVSSEKRILLLRIAAPAASSKPHGNAFPTAKPRSSRDNFCLFSISKQAYELHLSFSHENQ